MICEICGHQFENGASCPKCGAPAAATAIKAAPLAVQEPAGALVCTSCGASLHPGAKFCVSCGAKVAGAPAAPVLADDRTVLRSALAVPPAGADAKPVSPNAATPSVPPVSVPGSPPRPGSAASNVTAPQRKPMWELKISSTPGHGIALIAAGVVLFLICNGVQGMVGSSMFESNYYGDPDAGTAALVNLTFYPGWIGTIALIGWGVVMLFSSKPKQ